MPSARVPDTKMKIDPVKLAAKLAAEVIALKSWIRDEGERTDTCTYNVLREICPKCKCGRSVKKAKRK